MASSYSASAYTDPGYTRNIDDTLMAAANPLAANPTGSAADPASMASLFMANRARRKPAATAKPQNTTGASPANVQSHTREMLGNAGLAAGLQAAQAAVSLVPTTMDRENNQRLRELKEMQAQGRLGLSADQAAVYDQALSGARALAAGSQQAMEANAAASGTRTSAASLSRIQRDTQRGMLEQATEVGLAKADANRKAAEAQLLEMQQRLAAKDARQKQMLGAAASAIGAGGEMLGQVRAGRAIGQMDLSGLDLSAEEAATFMDALERHPQQAPLLVSLLAGRSPRSE